MYILTLFPDASVTRDGMSYMLEI